MNSSPGSFEKKISNINLPSINSGISLKRQMDILQTVNTFVTKLKNQRLFYAN